MTSLVSYNKNDYYNFIIIVIIIVIILQAFDKDIIVISEWTINYFNSILYTISRSDNHISQPNLPGKNWF